MIMQTRRRTMRRSGGRHAASRSNAVQTAESAPISALLGSVTGTPQHALPALAPSENTARGAGPAHGGVLEASGSGGHYSFPALDSAGREITVEFGIRRDTVDVRCAGRCRAVVDREYLRSWLALPTQDWEVDEVTWTAPAGDVHLAIAATGSWRLMPHVVGSLQDRI